MTQVIDFNDADSVAAAPPFIRRLSLAAVGHATVQRGESGLALVEGSKRAMNALFCFSVAVVAGSIGADLLGYRGWIAAALLCQFGIVLPAAFGMRREILLEAQAIQDMADAYGKMKEMVAEADAQDELDAGVTVQ